MKIIVLVLTHNDPLYNFFDRIKEKYLKSKNIEFKFLYNSVDMSLNDLKANKINYYTDEGPIPAMLKKFIDFIKQNRDYDYVIRVNSSTFINIDKIIELLQHQNEKDLYMGFFEKDWNFCSGALNIFSKSVIDRIVEGKDFLSYNIEDDLSIGNYLKSRGVKKTYLERYNISDRKCIPAESEIEKALAYPQIRIRNDFDRDTIDKGIWGTIKKLLQL
jgi:hypothetical protein